MRALLIHNPSAGSPTTAALLADVVAILRDGGVEARLMPTEAAGHATEIARDAARDGSTDWVLAFGGDGTVREAARGLLGSDVALAPLPAGTTNVVARSLGLPVDTRRAAGALLEATVIESDVGLCNEEPFLMQATLGLDAAIMAQVPSRLKRLAGRPAVVLSGLRTWARYPFPRIDFLVDGEPHAAYFVAACNIAHYAGDFLLVPRAGFATRRLDLLTFETPGRTAMLRFVLRLAIGKHLGMPGVAVRPVEEVVLPAPLAAPLQLDGDPLGLEPPLRIRLSEHRLRLLGRVATEG